MSDKAHHPPATQPARYQPVLSKRRTVLRYFGLLGLSSAAAFLASCARGKKQLAAAQPSQQASQPVPRPVRRRRALPVDSRRAMQELNATIARINSDYFSPQYGFNSVQDIAEGQRYLVHLMSAASEFYLEGNPEHPWFVDMISPVRKYLGDNPDARYFFTQVYGNRYYKIKGRRHGSEYISYTAHTGGRDGNWNGPGLFHINHRDILFDADGSYEILVGPQKRGAKNWLQTNKQVYHIVNRHYYEHSASVASDRNVVPELSIETLDPIPSPPTHPNDREIARGLRAMANFLRVSTLDMPRPDASNVPVWWSVVPNQMGQPVRFGDNQDDIGFGALDNTYVAGPYRLKPNEALVLDGLMPDCFFANVVLWNRFLQTDNYIHNQISLNRRQMKLGPDRSYRVVVAPHNPGVANWLSTCGRSSGVVQWRFLLAEGTVGRPRARVVPINQVSSLPA